MLKINEFRKEELISINFLSQSQLKFDSLQQLKDMSTDFCFIIQAFENNVLVLNNSDIGYH